MQTTSTSTLSQQLTAISDTLKHTNALIHRLSTLPFRPGSEPLTTQTTARLELAQDIHDTLKHLQDDLDLLALEAEDLQPASTAATSARTPGRRDTDTSRDRARLAAQIPRLQQDLRTAHSTFRRAQLKAKKASEAAKQQERQLLFSRLSDPTPPPTTHPADQDQDQQQQQQQPNDLFSRRSKAPQKQSQLSRDDLELDAAENITTSLRRTHALLTTELSRSRFAQETFDQSTAALAELGEKYDSLDSVLKGSRELLGTLLRSQKSDTWYLESALYILLGTVCWLFVHRILWGPFYQLPSFVWRWLVWPVVGTFLSVTGVYAPAHGGSAVGGSTVRLGASTTRPPLIVQPSAKSGSQPRFPEGMAGVSVPAGGGGQGAKVGKGEGVLEGEVSEGIGRMVEESQEVGGGGRGEDGKKKKEEEEEEEVVRRGDGTVLEERGDVPVNPKKRVMEGTGKDEL